MSRPGRGAGDVETAALEVRACAAADRAAQARLFNACFKKRVDAQSLAWRYDRSPHGASLSFMTVKPDGEGVCGYACSPRRMLAGGDEDSLAPVGETGDVMTHPEWRKRGLFSALDRACMAEAARRGWPCVFGLPNQRSAHIFLELGWKRVGSVRTWTHVMRGDARAILRSSGRLAAWLAPWAARRARASRRRLASAAAFGLDVRPLERFPAEVLAISRQVERRSALMARRDPAWLDWRFIGTPSGLHRALGLHARDGRLEAYSVVQIPRSGDGARAGWLVDALAPDERRTEAAVAAGLDALESAGAAAACASAIDGSPWQALLERAGFRPQPDDQTLAVIAWINQPEHPLARAALDAARWHLTDGDRDDETVG
jgi:GNAT superfamily N-acetyltransferase